MGTVLALVLAETGVRALGLMPPSWPRHLHVERADKRAALDLYPDDVAGDLPVDLRRVADRSRVERAGLTVAPEWAERTPRGVLSHFDARLCREERLPDTVSLLAVGDSFTEGQGVTREQAWPAVVEAQTGRRTLNCGRRGYDVEDVAGFLARQLDRQPTVVVYGMLLNDVLTDEHYPQQQFLDDWIVVRRRMDAPEARGLAIAGLIRDLAETRRVSAATRAWYAGLVEDNPAGWSRTRALVQQMQRHCEQAGVRFAVVLWPLLVELDEYPFAPVHAEIAAALEADGIEVLDLAPAFRQEVASRLWVHPVDHHPNARAHAIAGAAVGRWVFAPR